MSVAAFDVAVATVSCLLLAVYGYVMLIPRRSFASKLALLAVAFVSTFWAYRRVLTPPAQPIYGLWLIFPGFALVKLFHCAVDASFGSRYHLLGGSGKQPSAWRCAAFFLLPPTVLFDAPISRLAATRILLRGLLQMGVLAALAFFLLDVVGSIDSLPRAVQDYLRMIVLFLEAGAVSDLMFNGTARLLMGYDVIDMMEVVILSANGRDLWRRQSKNLGHHFRVAVYEQLGKTQVALLLVFVANTAYHALWMNPTIRNGEIGWSYLVVLLLPSFVLLIEPADKLIRFLMLHAGYALLSPVICDLLLRPPLLESLKQFTGRMA